MHGHSAGIYHFLIKLCGNGISCVPKVCGKMGPYQYEIITKPCLINENMTQVSELIYQKEHASLRVFSGNNIRGKSCIFSAISKVHLLNFN